MSSRVRRPIVCRRRTTRLEQSTAASIRDHIIANYSLYESTRGSFCSCRLRFETDDLLSRTN